jgi:putative AdoMet-dependent methyltransferase
MRSRHADDFNHDECAHGYDDDVSDETNPIRAGYRATLEWVVDRAAVGTDDVVVDLGIGTGNLARLLPPCRRLVGVDVSLEMLTRAAPKLGSTVELVPSDLLEVFERPDRYDVVVSTYAIHHLTSEEKTALLEAAASRLQPGGRLAVGDLMVAARGAVPSLRARLAHPDVDELFADEFPWYVDETLADLDRAGFDRLVAEQLSDLSWGVAASRPA